MKNRTGTNPIRPVHRGKTKLLHCRKFPYNQIIANDFVLIQFLEFPHFSQASEQEAYGTHRPHIQS
ncbi:MAG TPA: hypothetical protein VHR42_10450, partial [Clostridia bacterium]|nr:hypothetical protein [Clostridia bacterium]